jgi:tRNA (guanosine-2'-O-)-methyltransferase
VSLEARDRQELSKEQPPKPSKWPRTERRQARLRHVLEKRQPDLTIVLENVHDVHNASAVLRSCDATGVLAVHLVYTDEPPPERAFNRTTGAGASKWIELYRHGSIEECYRALREQGFRILTTALRAESKSIYEVDFTAPVAIVFGNEQRGVSEEAGALADGALHIPMMGVVESLNISVACAVTLYEAARQRLAAGHYEHPRLPEETFSTLYGEWLKR